MKILTVAVVVALTFAGGSAASPPTDGRTGDAAIRAAASIYDMRAGAGRVWIVRREQPGVEIPARIGEFLYGGDTLFVRGAGAEADLLIRGIGRPKPVTERESPFLISAVPKPSLADKAYAFLSAITWPWAAAPPAERRSRTYSRGIGGALIGGMIGGLVGGGSGAGRTRLRLSDTMRSGTLAVPDTASTLTVAWCGDAAYAQVYDAKGGGQVISTKGNVLRLSRRLLSGSNRLVVNDYASPKELTFTMQRVSPNHVPRPSWLSPNPGPEEQVAWAVWLLREGPEEFRAFGLSLLDAQRTEIPAAHQYFEAVTNCTDPERPATSPPG